MNSVIFPCLIVLMCIASDVSAQNRWSFELSPSVGSGGSWGIQGKIIFRFRRKRDIETHGQYSIELKLNPCHFKSYDENRDKWISFDEIKDIFGDIVWAKKFFLDSDSNKDGKISEKEFIAIRGNITGCS